MSKKIPSPAQTESPQDLLRGIFTQPVLPDERQESYDALRAVLFADLAPQSPYAALLAEQLVALEWDALRHRRLRDALLRAECRSQTAAAVDAVTRTEFLAFEPSEASQQLASDLVSRDDERRRFALNELAELEITPAEIMAKAYQTLARDLEPHERQIAEIDGRRRKLRADFDQVNAILSQPIEDAEIVET